MTGVQTCALPICKHVVFGEVTEGLDVLWPIEAQGSKDGKSKQKVIISDWGEYR